MAIAGLVTGGATALGLAALTVSLHLPTNAYKQERQRRTSEPQSVGATQQTRARALSELQKEGAKEGKGQMPPPGRRMSMGCLQK